MNRLTLNAIIFTSILGIIVVGITNFVFDKNTKTNKITKLQNNITPTIPPPTKSDLNNAEICNSKFIPFFKKVKWHYNQYALDGKSDTKKVSFISEFSQISSYSATISTIYNNKKDKTTLLCKNNGIYGLPFAFLFTQFISGSKYSDKLVSIDSSSLRLLPKDNQLINNETWKSPVSIEINLFAGFNQTLPIEIIHTIKKTSDLTLVVELKPDLTQYEDAISSVEQGKQLLGEIPSFEVNFKKDVGISHIYINNAGQKQLLLELIKVEVQ